MDYFISLLVNADNAIDVAHAERCPLPFLSCMVDDCIKEGFLFRKAERYITLPALRDSESPIWQILFMQCVSLYTETKSFHGGI